MTYGQVWWPILGICALQLTHPMCTHSVNTHRGLCCGAWGAGGWVPCSREPQSFVLRVERALDIHSPHLQFLPAWDSNTQPLDYKSDSLTISPRPPPPCETFGKSMLFKKKNMMQCHLHQSSTRELPHYVHWVLYVNFCSVCDLLLLIYKKQLR